MEEEYLLLEKIAELEAVVNGQVERQSLDPNFYEDDKSYLDRMLTEYKNLYGDDFVSDLASALLPRAQEKAPGYISLIRKYIKNKE